MTVVTMKDSNEIIAVTKTTSSTVDEGYTRIDDCGFIVKASGYDFSEVDEVPNEVVPYKYCYTAEKGFYINPNWNEEPEPQEQLYTLDEAAAIIASEVAGNE